MNSKYRIMFLRRENNHPIGCLAMHLNGDGEVSYQVSTLNPVDSFNRKLARQLALGRLLEFPITISTKGRSVHDITKDVLRDLIKDKSFPSRTRSAATRWLNSSKRTICDNDCANCSCSEQQ